MEEEDACGRAKAIESVMLPALAAMKVNHPTIGEIRGRGAMLAIELIHPGTMDPDPGAPVRSLSIATAKG